jgi:thymidylate synthase
MLATFEASSADDLWLSIADVFRPDAERDTREQESRAGQTHEILHAVISISDPVQRWVVSRAPALNPAFAIAEVVWILTGRNDARFLTYFNNRLPRYAGPGPTYHGAYGFRLRRHLKIDQLLRAFEALSHNPDSRQVVLQIWDSNIDLPDLDGGPRSADIPCNVMAMLKVRNGALEWFQVVRSNDLFKGMPYNLVQFTTLQEVLAGWLGLGVGSFNQVSDSLHVYNEELEGVVSSRKVVAPQNTDSIRVRKAESEALFSELSLLIDKLIEPSLRAAELEKITRWQQGPPAFRNMLLLVCAESARRRHLLNLAEEAMQHCTNPLFNTLWSRWQGRFPKAATELQEE